jgi:hypothetical protein
MLRRFTLIALNIGLLGAAIWAFAGDYCLISSSVTSPMRQWSAVVFAVVIQVLSLAAIFTGINQYPGYFRFVAFNVHRTTLKAALFLIPFLFLAGTHDLLAYAVFSTSSIDKLQNAASVAEGRKHCCANCVWPASCW